MGDNGGNYSNVNVKGTMNQCFVTQMMDVISAIDTTFIVSLNKTWRLRGNTNTHMLCRTFYSLFQSMNGSAEHEHTR